MARHIEYDPNDECKCNSCLSRRAIERKECERASIWPEDIRRILAYDKEHEKR